MHTLRSVISMRFLTLAALLVCALPAGARAQDALTAVRVVDVQSRTNVRSQAPEPTNVRLTFHLVEADGFEGVDPAISDVVGELRQLFRFDGYRLLDTSVLTGVIMHNDTDLVSQRLVFPELGTLEIEAFISESGTPNATRIHVNLRDANRDVPGGVRGPDIMSVSVNVRDGQTVVLGSGRSEGSEGALILVMSVNMNP